MWNRCFWRPRLTLITQAQESTRTVLLALSIIVDDDLERPIYVDPDPEDVEAEVWDAVCELVQELLDGERQKSGKSQEAGFSLVWRHLARQTLTFVAAAGEDMPVASISTYLENLSERYLDEVADPRNPERDGVADVVVDIIPPWEDDDDWAE